MGGDRQQMAGYAEALADRGYLTATIDYRRIASQDWFPTTEMTEPDLIGAAAVARHDAQTAVQWLIDHAEDERVDRSRIAIVGYSAGGITAIEVATHGPPEVLAAVSISGAGIDLAALAEPHPPLLLLHGTGDELVPLALARATCAASAGSCTVEEFPAVGHELPAVEPLQILNAIDTFLSAPRAAN